MQRKLCANIHTFLKKTKGPISKRKIEVILTEVTNIRFTVVGEIEDFRALTFKKLRCQSLQYSSRLPRVGPSEVDVPAYQEYHCCACVFCGECIGSCCSSRYVGTCMHQVVCVRPALCVIFMILVSLENVKNYSHVVARQPERLKSTLF